MLGCLLPALQVVAAGKDWKDEVESILVLCKACPLGRLMFGECALLALESSFATCCQNHIKAFFVRGGDTEFVLDAVRVQDCTKAILDATKRLEGWEALDSSRKISITYRNKLLEDIEVAGLTSEIFIRQMNHIKQAALQQKVGATASGFPLLQAEILVGCHDGVYDHASWKLDASLVRKVLLSILFLFFVVVVVGYQQQQQQHYHHYHQHYRHHCH